MSHSWRHILGMANENAKAQVEAKMNDAMDPKIQLNMAIQEMQEQYGKLKGAAATVIADAERQQQKASQLQRQIDQWTASAKAAVAAGRTDDARRVAMNIDGAQQQLQAINETLPQQQAAAEDAKKHLEAFANEMEAKMRQRAQLLNSLDQAKANEQLDAAMKTMSDMSGGTEIPSFDEIQDKIEQRAASARANASLSGTDPHLAELEVHLNEQNDRADAILASLGPAPEVPALGTGS